MTIKQRLALFVFIAVVFILISAGTGWYFFDLRIGKINLVKDEVGKISNQIIEGRVLEKRYLQFLDSSIRAEFDDKCKMVKENLLNLKSSFMGGDLLAHLESVSSKFEIYKNLFAELCQKIEENRLVNEKVSKPILDSRELLKQMQTKISDKQLEMQMVGEDLDSNHFGMVTLISEATTTLFRVETLQQQYLGSGKEELLEECRKILEKTHKEVFEGMVQYSSIIKDDELKSNSTKVSSTLDEFTLLLGTLKTSYTEQQAILKKLDETGNSTIQDVNSLQSMANDVIGQEKKLAYFYLGLVLVISILVFITTSFFITIRITKPLNEITEVVKEIARGNLQVVITHDSTDEIGVMTAAFKVMIAEQQKKVAIAQSISEGDFTHRVKLSSSTDSLGLAFNNMSGSLADVIKSINQCTERVASIAKRISEGADSLSAGSVKSAASLEELSSSLAEIGSQISSNAENALAASNLATEAMNSGNHGNEKMQEMTISMDKIHRSNEKISSILKVIEDIAFQTNLLALNAAVEAARAGRHGKGFAVVADEVRKLAARSAKAVKETSELLDSSSTIFGQGMETARKTATALSEIVETITKTTGLAHKISAASSEQAMGVSQINIGLEEIDKVTQHNAMEAEKSFTDSQELASQADELQILLSRFVLPEESK